MKSTMVWFYIKQHMIRRSYLFSRLQILLNRICVAWFSTTEPVCTKSLQFRNGLLVTTEGLEYKINPDESRLYNKHPRTYSSDNELLESQIMILLWFLNKYL